MYLKHVIIENFRGIEQMELALQPGVNLLIGDNGFGKTSVLEAIVAGLGACFKDLPGVSAASIKTEDIRQELQVVDGSPSVKFHAPTRISCEMDVFGSRYEWSRVRKDHAPNARTTIEYPDGGLRIPSWFRDAANDALTPIPVLNYQSINRVTASRRSDFGSSSKQLNDRRCGYIGCLDAALDDKFMRKWCYAMLRKRGTSPRYDLFRSAVSRVMQLLGELDTPPEIDFSEEFGEFGDFVYNENGAVMPISYLSAGYQSALWMVMDIAFRALLLNPGTTDLADIFGIVLIDEVDKHLHPKWQWNVLGALHATFPGVQFIITTHAPIVISSCKDATVLTIGGNHQVNRRDQTYGYRLEDVIRYAQGAHATLPELSTLYADFENACARRDQAAAARYFEELEAKFPQSTERTKAQTRLRFMKLGG